MTDINKLAQEMRETAEKATPGHWICEKPAIVLAILADRDALKAKLAEAERDRDGALDDRDRLREDVTDARRDRNLTNAALKFIA